MKSSSPSPGKNAEKEDFDDKFDNNVIPVTNIKTDHVERDAESLLVIFLYVKNVNKETAYVKFTEDSVTARFSTRYVRCSGDRVINCLPCLFLYLISPDSYEL